VRFDLGNEIGGARLIDGNLEAFRVGPAGERRRADGEIGGEAQHGKRRGDGERGLARP
jgi:hypothetical protein